MSGTEFLLTGDPDAAVAQLWTVLQESGWTPYATGPGWYTVERGDLTKTVLLGAFAGKGFHVKFPLAVGRDPEGRALVRVDRDSAMGAVKGGVIGHSKTGKAYLELVAQLTDGLHARGILEGSRAL